MTESPPPYTAGVVIAVDPQIMHICELLFYHTISAREAAKRLTELQRRRQREFLVGWVVVGGDVSHEVLMQEDELELPNG